MRWLRRAAVGLCTAATISATAGAQLVQTFEDLPFCNNQGVSVGLYAPVDYLNQWTCYSLAQTPFNPHSGTNRIFASNGATNTASASFAFAPMIFSGAWFSGFSSVSFQMFFLGNLVATSGSLATTATPAFLSSNYAGLVDRVTVVGTDVGYVMDDVTFGAASNVVPEPGSVILVGTGLIGIAAIVRRKRRTSM